MKRYTAPLFIITILLITAYLFFINKLNISIRLNELTASLQELDKNEKSIDHIGLIATYEISRKIYEHRIGQETADSLEHKVSSLLINESEQPAIIEMKYGPLTLPGIWIINFNRNILGKKPLVYTADTLKTHTDLDLAYYYERNYLFEHAIKLYDKALDDRTLGSTIRASILLHQGYCYALSGSTDSARKNYIEILEKYPLENSSFTAAILLRFLEGFQAARDRILGSNADPLTMSRDLMNLLAYKQAMQILREAEKHAAPGEIPMIKYFMARCYSGLDQTERAIEYHLNVITGYPASEYARFSNRRLLLIGTRSGDKNTIDISRKMNSKLKDPVFDQMDTEQGGIPDTENFEGIIKIDIPEQIMNDVNQFATATEKNEPDLKYLTIQTSDGNIFKGELVSENSSEIVIETSIGRIGVKKEKITKVTRTK